MLYGPDSIVFESAQDAKDLQVMLKNLQEYRAKDWHSDERINGALLLELASQLESIQKNW